MRNNEISTFAYLTFSLSCSQYACELSMKGTALRCSMQLQLNIERARDVTASLPHIPAFEAQKEAQIVTWPPFRENHAAPLPQFARPVHPCTSTRHGHGSHALTPLVVVLGASCRAAEPLVGRVQHHEKRLSSPLIGTLSVAALARFWRVGLADDF